jgi:hypothetical protein
MKSNRSKTAYIIFIAAAIIILLARMLDDLFIKEAGPARIPIKFADSSPVETQKPQPDADEHAGPEEFVPEPEKITPVPEPPHIEETEPVIEPTPVKKECSISTLSKEDVECWNQLFGSRVQFKSVISFEIINTEDIKDNIAGVLFTAVGRRTIHSNETMIVPEGYYEKNGAITDLFPTGADYAARVIYGFIATDAQVELKLFGQTNIFECGDSNRTLRRSIALRSVYSR